MKTFKQFYKNKSNNILIENNQVLNDLDGVKQVIDLAWTKHKNDIIKFVEKLISLDSSLDLNYKFNNASNEKKEPEIIKPSGVDSF